MLKWANFVEAGAAKVRLGPCHGVCSTEYSGATCVAIFQILMDRGEFFVHHGFIGQDLLRMCPLYNASSDKPEFSLLASLSGQSTCYLFLSGSALQTRSVELSKNEYQTQITHFIRNDHARKLKSIASNGASCSQQISTTSDAVSEILRQFIVPAHHITDSLLGIHTFRMNTENSNACSRMRLKAYASGPIMHASHLNFTALRQLQRNSSYNHA